MTTSIGSTCLTTEYPIMQEEAFLVDDVVKFDYQLANQGTIATIKGHRAEVKITFDNGSSVYPWFDLKDLQLIKRCSKE